MSIYLHTVSNLSLLFMPVSLPFDRSVLLCLLQQVSKKEIGSAILQTQQYNFQPPTPTLNAAMLSITDKQTDRQTDISIQTSGAKPPVWLVLFSSICSHSLELTASQHSFLWISNNVPETP